MVLKKKGGRLCVFLLMMTFCMASVRTSAQVDAHFSQYYAYPLWLNPGLTGRIDGDFRLSANFKRQWASIATPFQTMALSYDAPAFSHLSYGITVLNQTAGDAGYQYLNVLGSVAYEVILDADRNNILSIGMQAGMINRQINPSRFHSGGQWTPVLGFDPTLPSGEVLDRTSTFGLDANFGVFYVNRNRYSSFRPFVGVSLYHLSRPSNAFLAESNQKLPMRLNVHGGVRMQVNEKLSLTPHFLYLHQGNADEKVGGIYGQYNLNEIFDFVFGASLRYKDAVIPFVGMLWDGFSLGLSYDINVSDLGVASVNNGGFELSLTFVKRQEGKIISQLSCPRF